MIELYITHRARYWRKNSKIHRLNGPAVEGLNGYKAWYQNNFRHRLDGPADWYDGKPEWWYKGQIINCSSQEEFERWLKLRLLW